MVGLSETPTALRIVDLYKDTSQILFFVPASDGRRILDSDAHRVRASTIRSEANIRRYAIFTSVSKHTATSCFGGPRA